MLMQVGMPTPEFNEMSREGHLDETLQKILDDTKPEAVYFTEIDGWRTVLLIVNMTDASQAPKFAEPWFLLLNADVRWHIVMTPEDLGRAGLAELGKKWA